MIIVSAMLFQLVLGKTQQLGNLRKLNIRGKLKELKPRIDIGGPKDLETWKPNLQIYRDWDLDSWSMDRWRYVFWEDHALYFLRKTQKTW